MSIPGSTDVLVVGAGLAGLRCATLLEDAGLDVTVMEAGDAVGGRVRTEAVDGFLVDRGFQLLNPSYPEARAALDLDALGLGAFDAGVVAATDAGVRVLGHPWHAPSLLPSTVRAVGPQALRAVALARWLAPLARRPGAPVLPAIRRRADLTLRDSLDRAGVRGLTRDVLEAFLAGVVLDDTGATSTHLAQLLVHSFVAGTPGLPAAGMQAMPEQLAGRLRRPVATGVLVESVGDPGAERTVVTDHGAVSARTVVVAAGPTAAADLLGTSPTSVRGVVTTWYDAPDVAPEHPRLLRVDTRSHRPGPLVNAAVISAAAPSYAPPGRTLVSASALARPGAVPTDADMRRHAADLLGGSGDRWEVVARHEVLEALPAQPPPLRPRQSVRHAPGLYVCGDHRDTASIQGALVSGRRAADAVLAERA